MYVTQIEVDLSGEWSPPVIYAKQGDVGARQADIGFLDHGVPYEIPEGATARIWVKKPDGTAVWNDASISDNRVIVDLTSQMLVAAGDALAEIALYIGDEQILSCSIFILRIEKNARSEQAVESGNEFGVLDSLVQEAQGSIPAATEAAAAANEAAEAANQAAAEATEAAEAASETTADIIEMKNNGEFNGTNGVVMTASGIFGFYISEGHLYYRYFAEDEPMDFRIENGHLRLRF